jgi:hypothetical protein
MKLTKKIIAATAIALSLPGVASAASLSVSPQSQTVKKGETINVVVKLDTQGSPIDGVDLRFLNFNASLLQVVDADPSKDGVQITPDTLMPTTLSNKVDNVGGRIAFSQVVTGGTSFKGAGTLATIQFKAINSGTANITFSHTPGETRDSNVATAGKDVLTSVINGSITITGAAAAANTTKTTNNQTQSTTNTNTNSQTVTNSSVDSSQVVDGENPDFQFSQKKGFWEIFVGMIKDFFAKFTSRF